MNKIIIASVILLSMTGSVYRPETSNVFTCEQSRRGDAVFSQLVPDNNYGQLPDIHLYAWTQNGELNVNRVALDFDLRSIPSKAVIQSAYLNVYFNPVSAYDKLLGSSGHQGHSGFIIQQITSDWHEDNITWRTQPSTTDFNQVIVKRKTSPSADYVNINVTRLIQSMHTDHSPDYGLMLRLVDEEPYNVLFFASSEFKNKNLRPSLVVTYQ